MLRRDWMRDVKGQQNRMADFFLFYLRHVFFLALMRPRPVVLVVVLWLADALGARRRLGEHRAR